MSRRVRFFAENCYVIPTVAVDSAPTASDSTQASEPNPQHPRDASKRLPAQPGPLHQPGEPSVLDLLRVPDPLGDIDPSSSPEARRQFKRDIEAGLAASAEAIAKRGGGGKPKVTVEITNKVMGDRFHLCPDAEVDDIFVGALGRAVEHSGAEYNGGHNLSNHIGQLVTVESVDQLADFTRFLFQATSYRIRRHLGLETPLWAGRYHAVVLVGDEATQAERMKYCLANGTKENLVAHPSQWPGIHSARFFCNNEPLVGTWTDFTSFGKAKRRDPNARIEDHQTRYTIKHTKLPCFAHLSDDDYAAMMKDWCDEAAENAAAKRAELRAQGKPAPEPGDPELLRRVDLNHRPENPARSNCPLVHSVDPAAAKRYREAYKAYVAHHQAVRAALAAGLKAKGVDFTGGLLPTGWVPMDPATVVQPQAIVLSEVTTIT